MTALAGFKNTLKINLQKKKLIQKQVIICRSILKKTADLWFAYGINRQLWHCDNSFWHWNATCNFASKHVSSFFGHNCVDTWPSYLKFKWWKLLISLILPKVFLEFFIFILTAQFPCSTNFNTVIKIHAKDFVQGII